SSNVSHFFGCPYRDIWRTGNNLYNSGGGGYVLSKMALEQFITKALNHSKCVKPEPRQTKNSKGSKSKKVSNRGEDLEIANCLKLIGILPEDTRDHENRSRIFQGALRSYLYPFSNHTQENAIRYYRLKHGASAVSERLISFHKVTPSEMYVFEFLLYHAKTALPGDRHLATVAI
ncbi:unnamed protein product, partial [Allacma fusca]